MFITHGFLHTKCSSHKSLLNRNIESNKIYVVTKAFKNCKAGYCGPQILISPQWTFKLKFKDTPWQHVPVCHTSHFCVCEQHSDRVGLCRDSNLSTHQHFDFSYMSRALAFLHENSLTQSLTNTVSGPDYFSLLYKLPRECLPYVFPSLSFYSWLLLQTYFISYYYCILLAYVFMLFSKWITQFKKMHWKWKSLSWVRL